MKWISVEERLPEIGKKILFTASEHCCSGDNIEIGKYYYAKYLTNPKFIWENSSGNTVINVTHWMPLPEKPE